MTSLPGRKLRFSRIFTKKILDKLELEILSPDLPNGTDAIEDRLAKMSDYLDFSERSGRHGKPMEILHELVNLFELKKNTS